MASEWLECTAVGSGETIFINFATALTIRRDGQTTWVWFATGSSDDDCVKVMETPEDILVRLKNLRIADRT